jgi:HlyD family secretion protein
MPYNEALRAGSFAEAHFDGSTRTMLTVPASAIRYESGGPGVMVVDDNNKVSRVAVKLGERIGDYVQLVEGPPANTRVLSVGAAFTLEGDTITPVEDDAVAQGASPAQQSGGTQQQ